MDPSWQVHSCPPVGRREYGERSVELLDPLHPPADLAGSRRSVKRHSRLTLGDSETDPEETAYVGRQRCSVRNLWADRAVQTDEGNALAQGDMLARKGPRAFSIPVAGSTRRPGVDASVARRRPSCPRSGGSARDQDAVALGAVVNAHPAAAEYHPHAVRRFQPARHRVGVEPPPRGQRGPVRIRSRNWPNGGRVRTGGAGTSLPRAKRSRETTPVAPRCRRSAISCYHHAKCASIPELSKRWPAMAFSTARVAASCSTTSGRGFVKTRATANATMRFKPQAFALHVANGAVQRLRGSYDTA